MQSVSSKPLEISRGQGTILWCKSININHVFGVCHICMRHQACRPCCSGTSGHTVCLQDLTKDVFRIDAIPSQSLDTVREWLSSMDIKFYENKVNLNWKQVLKSIVDVRFLCPSHLFFSLHCMCGTRHVQVCEPSVKHLVRKVDNQHCHLSAAHAAYPCKLQSHYVPPAYPAFCVPKWVCNTRHACNAGS